MQSTSKPPGGLSLRGKRIVLVVVGLAFQATLILRYKWLGVSIVLGIEYVAMCYSVAQAELCDAIATSGPQGPA